MSHPPFHLLHGPLRTTDGWTLLLRRASRGGRPGSGPPILLVPGYGMNASIFAFHPEGPGLLEHLLDAGFDPWALDLRGTSTSSPPLRRARARLADQAWIDLPAAMERIAHVTRHERMHAIGCSLGGALLYAHVGRDAHRVDKLVTMGSPLAWSDRTLPLHAFSRLGRLAGVPIRGTRAAARLALPAVRRFAPGVLSFYLNPAVTDTTRSGPLIATVEDPHPDVSVTLSSWVRSGRLVLDGHDVAQGLQGCDRPLLIVYATDDGVVPPSASLAAARYAAGPVDTLPVGDEHHRVSHVDLFLGRHAQERVYTPIARWLHAS